MRMSLAVAAAVCYLVADMVAQTAQTQAPAPAGPVFDVVSIRPSPPLQRGNFIPPTDLSRPDGGLTMTQAFVGTLILRAYPTPGMVPADIVGLPEWTRTERFDIGATSTLTRATPEDRIAMLRGMLADRFKLLVHVEPRPQQVFEMVLARGDRRLGKGLTPIEADCAAQVAARNAAAEAARNEGRAPDVRPTDFTKPPAPCSLRAVTGRPISRDGGAPVPPATHMEGEAAMGDLANFLRLATRRAVMDKTELPGSYRIAMDFDMIASLRGPDVAAAPDSGPNIFTAIQEQLGLKLQPATMVRDTLIIDRLERPTEN